jgi:hypothetical protein
MEHLVQPGSFIWRWISDEWLISKSASLCFGLSVLVIVWMSVVIVSGLEPEAVGATANVLLGVGGVLGAISVFFLWGGMWRYWARHSSQSPRARGAWFFVLLVGAWYGAILYYSFVYLPGREKPSPGTGNE